MLQVSATRPERGHSSFRVARIYTTASSLHNKLYQVIKDFFVILIHIKTYKLNTTMALNDDL